MHLLIRNFKKSKPCFLTAELFRNKDTLFKNKEILFRIKNLSQKSNLKTIMITCNFNLVYLFNLLTPSPCLTESHRGTMHRESTVIALQKGDLVQKK